MTAMPRSLSPEEIDARFDDGDELEECCDWGAVTVTRPEAARQAADTQQVNVNLPRWLLSDIDAEAARRGVPRRSIINAWLVDRADEERRRAS